MRDVHHRPPWPALLRHPDPCNVPERRLLPRQIKKRSREGTRENRIQQVNPGPLSQWGNRRAVG
eukprot:UN29399